LFKTKNKVYLHRLIAIDEETFIFQGDALRQKEYAHFSDIIGQVTQIKKNNKTINPQKPYYRFKVACWLIFKPLRRILLKIMK
jgi:hypothetical protein